MSDYRLGETKVRFIATADTDIGTNKNTNQDSALIKHAETDNGEVLMAVVCDGMGGLSKGELASATVIRAFSKWFDEELPNELAEANSQIIGNKWASILQSLNLKLLKYGKKYDSSLGTTFSGLFFIGDHYVVVHVGDSRVYQIGASINQITADQTFVAREISRGTLTPEEAKTDKRRNMLLQCIGASNVIEPQVVYGTTEKGAYMLCTDGFCHKVTEDEICTALNPDYLTDRAVMHDRVRYLIEQIKSRKERDNISAILIRAD